MGHQTVSLKTLFFGMDELLEYFGRLNEEEKDLSRRYSICRHVLGKPKRDLIPREYNTIKKKMWYAKLQKNKERGIYETVEMDDQYVDPFFTQFPTKSSGAFEAFKKI